MNSLVHAQDFAREPYLQLATPHSIQIIWRTLGPIQPIVRYGVSPQTLDRQVDFNETRTAVFVDATNQEPHAVVLRSPRYARLPKLHSAPAGTVQYEARVIGLQPDTRYYYAVFDGDKRLTPEDPSYTFQTHPLPGQSKSARILVIGDSGTGQDPQRETYDAMLDYVKRDRRPLDFYIHVGDMAYSEGKDREFQKGFFDVYKPTLRQVVCWPTMGNHEGITSRGTNGIGPYYDAYVVPTRAEAGGLASGTEAYYSFDFGRVHFICLDSHDLDRSPSGAMSSWLKADLERVQSDWLVAFWHHPPYTKGSHDSDRENQLIEMRTHIMPILESGGVDLVLTGHSHIYERSMLMDGAYATPTVAEYVILDDRDGDPLGEGPYIKNAGLKPNSGDVQVVAGHGGASLSRKGTMPVMKRVIVEHGTVLIDIDGDTLTGVMINRQGELRDRFSIVKRGNVELARMATPRQLPPYSPPPPRRGGDGGLDVPSDGIALIPQDAEWLYLGGTHPEGLSWAQLDFKAVGWKVGRAPFGYDDQDTLFNTELKDMKDNYSILYLRRGFVVPNPAALSEFGLVANYDDAFIAYVNGQEILRKGVREGRGPDAGRIFPHEARGHKFYPIEDFQKYLRPGANMLAIEAFNREASSSDFVFDAYLIMDN